MTAISSANAVTCTSVPSCASLGYTDTTLGCTNYIKCPFNTSEVLCLDKVSPLKSFSNCKQGQYLTSANDKIVCTDYPIGNEINKIVVSKEGSYVYYIDVTDPKYFDIPMGLYSNNRSTEDIKDVRTAISNAHPACKLIPEEVFTEHASELSSKLGSFDIILSDASSVKYFDMYDALDSYLFAKGNPTKYLCAKKVTEGGTWYGVTGAISQAWSNWGQLAMSYPSPSSTTISTVKTNAASYCSNGLTRVNSKYSLPSGAKSGNAIVIFDDVIFRVENGMIKVAVTNFQMRLNTLQYVSNDKIFYACNNDSLPL